MDEHDHVHSDLPVLYWRWVADGCPFPAANQLNMIELGPPEAEYRAVLNGADAIKYQVFGYYEDNEQVFCDSVWAANPESAAADCISRGVAVVGICTGEICCELQHKPYVLRRISQLTENDDQPFVFANRDDEAD